MTISISHSGLLTSIVSRYSSGTVWLGMVGLWVGGALSIVVPGVSLTYMTFLDGFERTITGRLLRAQTLGPDLMVTGRGSNERLRLMAWLTSQQSSSLDLSAGFLASFLDSTQTLGRSLQGIHRFN